MEFPPSADPVADDDPSHGSSDSGERKRKRKRKRKRINHSSSSNDSESNGSGSPSVGGGESTFSWKSSKTRRTYSSRLLRALCNAHLNPPASSSAPRRGRAVREAADRALAVSARGRTRWSRAILSSRMMKLKLTRRKCKRVRDTAAAAAAAGGSSRGRSEGKGKWKGKDLPDVQRKARFLGRLVPGCRKEPLPVILEEASDYIEALEMQVRAMTALAELLSRSAATTTVHADRPGQAEAGIGLLD